MVTMGHSRDTSFIMGCRAVRMSLIMWALALVREMFVGLVCSMGHHEGYGKGNGFLFMV